MLKLRWMMAQLPLVALGLGIFFLRAYKLTEKSVNERQRTVAVYCRYRIGGQPHPGWVYP